METTYVVFLHINKPLHSATHVAEWIGLLNVNNYDRINLILKI